jgi:hypothetical protein
MATLTADEITFIRAMSGDDCANPEYEVSDVLMQYLHEYMATTAPMCLSSIPLGGTIVWVLRARLAKAQKLTDETGEGNAGNVKQKRDHIKEDLEAWESRCGMNGGVVTVSTLDLGLDRDDPETEYARYGSDYTWLLGYFG